MSSSESGYGQTGSTEAPGNVFKELWSKVKDCHDEEVQALQSTVSQLRNDHCSDVQRLQELHTTNQQLRDHHSSLQEAIAMLEGRLTAGLCERCTINEENTRKKQQELESIRKHSTKLVTELMIKKNSLQEDNKKLSEHIRQLQIESSQGATAPPTEVEDGVIPDSPVSSTSLPMARRRQRKRGHSSLEIDLQQSEPLSEFGKSALSSTQIQSSRGEDVLVADTCDPGLSPILTQCKTGSVPPQKAAFKLAVVIPETLGLGILEESESQSVISPPRSSCTRKQLAQIRLDSNSRKPLSLESSRSIDLNMVCSKAPQAVLDRDCAPQQASRVFKNLTEARGSLDLNTSSSPSLLGTGIHFKTLTSTDTSDIRSQKVRSRSDDLVLTASQQFGAAVNSLPRQPPVSKHKALKRSMSDSVSSPIDMDDFFMVRKHPGGKARKTNKAEENHDGGVQALNKEYNCSLKKDCNRGNSVEMAVEISNPVSAIQPPESSHGREHSKANLKKNMFHDVLKHVHNGSLSIGQTASKGSCKGSRYPKEDLRTEVANHLAPGEISPSEKTQLWEKDSDAVRRAPLPNCTKDSDRLLDDMKFTSFHEPARSKPMGELRGCEPASLRQLTPQEVVAQCKPLQHEQGVSSLDNLQWSIDPGAHLSQYNMDITGTDTMKGSQTKREGEDTDYTYSSKSVQFKLKKPELVRGECPEGETRRNDSLGEMFDRTPYEEYESCLTSGSPSGMDCRGGRSEEEQESPPIARDKVNNQEETRGKTKRQAFVDPDLKRDERKKGLDFPHIEVVRNKAERRRMLGYTCKECETYYADLPEDERAKKLASCSRHRFRYIPPGTPENFWEVGFPTTQTCVDRGYVKDELSPCQRPRRRQPYNATFSPKSKKQKT